MNSNEYITSNFERLVLGCIETNLCKQILVGKLLTRSTRFTNFCTAPHSKIQLNFVKHFRIFTFLFQTFHSFLAIFVQMSPIILTNFSGISADLLEEIKISYILKFPETSHRKLLIVHKTIVEKLEKSWTKN